MESVSIVTSLLFFYLKARIDFEENFIKLKNPNVILGFIPFGSKKFSIAINQISSVDTNFKLLFKDFLVGLIEIFAAIFCFYNEVIVVGIILILLGIVTIINSFQLHLNINTTSGQVYYLSVFIFQKSKLKRIEEAINNLIANRLNDTNNRKVAEQQTSEIVGAIKDLKN